MKTKNILLVASLGLLAFLPVSCELDLYPTTAIVTEEAFQTYKDATLFANGLSARYRGCFYGVHTMAHEVQGDMFNASLDYGNNYGSVHRMDGSFTSGTYELRDVWRPCYSAILAFNNFLENIDNVVPANDTEKSAINAYIGMAYFYRASIFHELIRRFAKDYDPGTASSDLGVPLIVKIDYLEKPARATVAEVYAQIESDIAQARTLLAGKAGQVGAITPTIDAVKALDARVKLFMHKYSEAAAIAQELISSGKYKLSTTQEEMNKEWKTDNGTESILQLFTNLSEGANTNVNYLSYNTSAKVYVPYFIPTQTCVNMYEPTDLRRTTWFAELPTMITGHTSNLILFTKYEGNVNYEVAPNRSYKHRPKIFNIAEMYLIRAEALLSQSSPATDQAKTTLNALQVARGATPTAATMANVKKEWAKETIGEGMRITCLNRWNEGFSGRIPQSTLVVNIGAPFNEISVPAGFAKLVWAMPLSDMEVNANLVQNPGWDE